MSETVIVCGGDSRLGDRGNCPNTLHDWPLAAGYVEAADMAMSRFARKWTNKRCPDCRLYGWIPGRLDDRDQEVRKA